jgi:hypothetical protein
MNEIILLKTDWDQNYWNNPKTAPFKGKNMTYEYIENWHTLSKACPLPGIGIYYKRKKNDYRHIPFVYLKITGMSFDNETKNPSFSFDIIKVSSTQSEELRKNLPYEHSGLYSTIATSQLLEILDRSQKLNKFRVY